jgi:hypothetical protein
MLFHPLTGLTIIFQVVCQIISGEIFSCIELSVYGQHISDYSCDVQAPLTGWHPEQLQSWPAPYSGHG